MTKPEDPHVTADELRALIAAAPVGNLELSAEDWAALKASRDCKRPTKTHAEIMAILDARRRWEESG